MSFRVLWQTLHDPTRLRILALLSGSELTVSELTEILRQSQPRISRHLKLLADAGRGRTGSHIDEGFRRRAEGCENQPGRSPGGDEGNEKTSRAYKHRRQLNPGGAGPFPSDRPRGANPPP